MSVFYLIPGPRPEAPESSATSTKSGSHEKDSKTHRSDIWFEDGNIILQAQNTQFRIHRGIVALHSRVFKGMFPIPLPEGEPLVDGCPLVHVFDDPEDWRNLLDIIYNSRKVYKSKDAIFPIKPLIAMLRLGQKYEFEDFRDDALERLKAEFTTELDEYDALVDPAGTDDESSLRLSRVSTDGNEFDILNIALELGIQTILPMAYLICIRDLPLESIFEGQTRADGSTVNLSRASQAAIILGHRKLVDAITRACRWLKGDHVIPSEKCISLSGCTQSRMEILEGIYFDGVPLSLDPGVCSISYDAENVLCDACFSVAEAHYGVGREEIWKELPSYFMLPLWEDLKDFEL